MVALFKVHNSFRLDKGQKPLVAVNPGADKIHSGSDIFGWSPDEFAYTVIARRALPDEAISLIL